MGGWTSVVGCRAVMLLGPRLPSSSRPLSFSHSPLCFRPLSFVFFLPPSHRSSRSCFVSFSFSLFLCFPSPRLGGLEGLELAGRHYGGYSVGFSHLSKAHKRVCPPEGQGTPSGTGSPPSLPLFASPSLSFPLSLAAPCNAANPPYAPSGSYLRVLLIFSYYRRGHVGTSYAHICASSSYVHTRGTVHRGPADSSPSVLLSGTPICEHIITEA